MKKIIAVGTGLAMLAGALPAFAAGNVSITVSNNATLTNTAVTSAATGSNSATGSSATNSSAGGDMSSSTGGANKNGNGGNGISGGGGGLIQTGNASALSQISNDINSSDFGATVTPWVVGDVAGMITNALTLTNSAAATAVTDHNTASGSTAANTSTGGANTSAGGANQSGNGGNNMDGGSGGAIATGNSNTTSTIVSIMNRTMTRFTK